MQRINMFDDVVSSVQEASSCALEAMLRCQERCVERKNAWEVRKFKYPRVPSRIFTQTVNAAKLFIVPAKTFVVTSARKC